MAPGERVGTENGDCDFSEQSPDSWRPVGLETRTPRCGERVKAGKSRSLLTGAVWYRGPAHHVQTQSEKSGQR